MAQGGKDTFDLEGFLARPREAAPAHTDQEVRIAIEERLRVEPVYRVRFKVKPEGEEEEDFEGFDWEGVG